MRKLRQREVKRLVRGLAKESSAIGILLQAAELQSLKKSTCL